MEQGQIHFYGLQIQQISELLLQQKQLEVLYEIQLLELGDSHTFVAKDENQEYLIQVYIIQDGLNSLGQDKFQNIKLKVQALQECSHPNIIKCFDQFIIDQFQFILLEKCNKSLYDYITKAKNEYIPTKDYLHHAQQILEGLQYLHSKNLFLKYPSLKSILLDQENNIKLTEFEYLAEQNRVTQSSMLCSTDYLIYTPPEILKVNNLENKMCQDKKERIKGDIWSVCMYLYVLAGAEKLHCIYFASGKENYQLQQKVDHNINLILNDSLQRDPNLRPSLDQLIRKFRILEEQKNEILQESEEENEIFKKAQQLFDLNKYDQSIELLKQLQQLSPNNDKYIAWIGRLYNSCDRLKESEYWSKQALKINPENEIAYFNLGNTYKNRQLPDIAINFYEKALQINPKNDFVLNNLGLVYDQKKSFQQADLNYLKALEINPQKQNSLYNLGASYYQQTRYQEAIQCFEKVIELNPKYISALSYLGCIKSVENQTEQAQAYLKQSLKINPSYQHSLFQLGNINYKQAKYQHSYVYFKKAKKNLKTNNLFYSIGSNFYCSRQYDQAIKYYKKSQNINSNHQECLTYLKGSKRLV